MNGKVYLVGAGPGDPDLLTVRAVRVLNEIDVLLYDRLAGEKVLALVNPLAERIYVGKHEGEQEATQNMIFELMLHHARAGRTVARLKGGDPSVFGRAAEEWQVLAEAGVEVEVVPGISSAIAAAELAGVPLTARGISHGFAVVTGHGADEGPLLWHKYAGVDTLVVLMGVKERAEIALELIRAGRKVDEPVMFVERATTPREKVIVATLGEVAAGSVAVNPPAVFVIGAVVNLRALLTRVQMVAA